MSLIVARRYARALYEDADNKDAVKHVDEDIEMIQESMAESPELRRFFEDPMIPVNKKERVIENLFTKRVHDITLSFLTLITKKRRENLFPQMASAYSSLRNEQLGIVEATVRVALPLDKGDAKKIKSGIESMTGREVRLQTEVDPSILGGIIIRVGDMVYDGSVQHKLDTLKDRLAISTFLAN